MFGIEHRVAETARKAGLVTASAVLTSVGAAFWTTAAWIYLSTEHSAVFAAVLIALFYSGLGIVLLAIAISRPRQPDPRERDALGGLSPMQLVAVSFLQGLDQGKKARRSS